MVYLIMIRQLSQLPLRDVRRHCQMKFLVSKLSHNICPPPQFKKSSTKKSIVTAKVFFSKEIKHKKKEHQIFILFLVSKERFILPRRGNIKIGARTTSYGGYFPPFGLEKIGNEFSRQRLIYISVPLPPRKAFKIQICLGGFLACGGWKKGAP